VLRILGCFLSSDGCDIGCQHRRGPGHRPAGSTTGAHGHAGGLAVDISTIDGHPVNNSSARAVVIQVDEQLRNAGALRPRQLITGGVGNKIDQTIEALTIPDPAFYGPKTMQDHTNHIHVGY
jgi:hypothetical protein